MAHTVPPEAKTHKFHLRYWESLKWAARKNRKKETNAEDILWQVLRNKKLGYKFTRQKPVGRFIVDFYSSKLLLVIEIDGSSHNEKRARDQLRDEYLKACGIATLRFTNEEILNDLETVKNKILEFILASPLSRGE